MKHSYTLLMATAALAFMLMGQANAKTGMAAVIESVKSRADGICKDVVPVWIKSKRGMHDKSVRRIVVDCYLAQVRLPLIGATTETLDATVILDEVPAALLENQTGMKFDVYRPIAGSKIRVREVRQSDHD